MAKQNGRAMRARGRTYRGGYTREEITQNKIEREETIEVKSKDKKFRVYWGEGYTNSPLSKTVGIKFFTEDMGYESFDIYKIHNLRVGETYKNFDPSGYQSIKRIR